MKFWNYIGEFFLFRWLLGKRQQKEGEESVADSNSRQSLANDDFEQNDIPVNRPSHYTSHNYHIDDHDGWNNQSFDDFHEEQDDFDMMD